MYKRVEVDLSNYPDRQKMDQRKDYTEVRDNLKDVIDNSKLAIDKIESCIREDSSSV